MTEIPSAKPDAAPTPTTDSLKPSWNMLLALVVAMLLIFGSMFYAEWLSEIARADREWWMELVEVGMHFIVAFLLVFALLEWPHFQSVIRAQLEKVIAGESNLIKEDYLRRRFRDSTLKDIRRATTVALAGRSLNAEEHKLLDDFVYPALDGLQRRNWKIFREYDYIDADHKFFKIHEQISFECYAGSGQIKKWTLPLLARMKRLPDHDDERLCVLTECTLNGDRFPCKLVQTKDNGSISFDGRTDIDYEGPTQVRIVLEKIIPTDDRWSMYFPFPTHGVEIQIKYPTDLQPRLYLFGVDVADPENPPLVDEAKGGGFKHWKHDGWLFKNHGWTLLWKDPAPIHSDPAMNNQELEHGGAEPLGIGRPRGDDDELVV